jgi:hypothetical protein
MIAGQILAPIVRGFGTFSGTEVNVSRCLDGNSCKKRSIQIFANLTNDQIWRGSFIRLRKRIDFDLGIRATIDMIRGISLEAKKSFGG